jgi:hypothetical protein
MKLLKKVLSIFLSMSLCFMLSIQVSAAGASPKENTMEKEEISATLNSDCFSCTLSRFALMNGTATVSSGSISGNAQVTSISLYVSVSSGGSPVIIYIQAPDGTTNSFRIITSGTITTNQFNGCDPSGNWKIWVEPKEIIPSLTLKVCYDYIYD